MQAARGLIMHPLSHWMESESAVLVLLEVHKPLKLDVRHTSALVRANSR